MTYTYRRWLDSYEINCPRLLDFQRNKSWDVFVISHQSAKLDECCLRHKDEHISIVDESKMIVWFNMYTGYSINYKKVSL